MQKATLSIEAINFSGFQRRKPKGAGWMNLFTHIIVSSDNRQLDQFFYPKKAIKFYCWLEWLIMNGYPFSFIENIKYYNLSKILRHTFVKDLQLMLNALTRTTGNGYHHWFWKVIFLYCSKNFWNLKVFASAYNTRNSILWNIVLTRYVWYIVISIAQKYSINISVVQVYIYRVSMFYIPFHLSF